MRFRVSTCSLCDFDIRVRQEMDGVKMDQGQERFQQEARETKSTTYLVNLSIGDLQATRPKSCAVIGFSLSNFGILADTGGGFTDG
jgi:hypothetical protein